MRILLTGSSGFIGKALTPVLEKYWEVHHLESNLTDYDKVKQEVKQINPNIIVHLAARTEVEKSFTEQLSFSEINYLGTVNLIESTRQLKNFTSFLFASTMEVYGWQPISDEIKYHGKFTQRQVYDEKTIPNPNAPYAVAKYACEKYIEYASRAYHFPYTIIRQTNTYGRHDNDFFVTEALITRMLRSKESINMGYAEPWRNFLYIDDLINIWTKIIAQPTKARGAIITIGPDNAISIKDYAELIAKKLNWQGNIEWNKQPKREGEIYWLNSGNKLTQTLYNWTPEVDLDTGLDKTIAVWKEKLK
jgi:nucleoside-diphosphate-sugar epimerase